MNLTQEKALFHLAGKLTLSQLNMDSLEQLVNQYPYFTPARFFIASKKYAEKQDDSTDALQKANLYFTNPLWLQFQLHHSLNGHHTIETKKKPSAPLPTEMVIPTVEAVKAMMRDIDYKGETQQEEEDPLPDGAENDMAEPLEDSDSKISGILSEQLADFKKPLDADAKLDIENEKQRLFTIDYFASQGIKIDLDKIPQDKLTKNLLKFTDWLKQIKQVPAAELGANLEREKAVAETALQSNETREIVTESMSEVLIKQGQTDKAIQLLIKLSFLNPEKSSYFASKIEQLKGL